MMKRFLPVVLLAVATAAQGGLGNRSSQATTAATPIDRSIVAYERVAYGSRPLFRHPNMMAFRSTARPKLSGKLPQGVSREAMNSESGISVFRIHGDTPTRRSLSESMLELGGAEVPCYTAGGKPWIVPTDLIIVQFMPHTSQQAINSFLDSHEAAIVKRRTNHPNQFIVRVHSPVTAMQMAYTWNRSDIVRWAQANCIRETIPRFIPNDTLFPEQWHHYNTNQNGSVLHRDVRAPYAWDITLGSTNVVIAVLDDGFETNHIDLADNVITGGWDFVDNDGDVSPLPGRNHGMRVVGLCSAVADNNEGVAGLAPLCGFLPIRVYSTDGMVDINWADSIEYAADRADVINISYLIEPTLLNFSSIRYAVTSGREGLGCVICGAYGNDGVFRRYIKDAVTSAEVLGVSGTSNYDRKSWFSDYGPSLRIVGPAGGGNSAMITLDVSNTYSTNGEGGTSLSCPLATAAAALLISEHPDWPGLKVKRQIEETCDKIDWQAYSYNGRGWNNRYGFGRLNAYAALTTPPSPWDPYEPDDSSAKAVMIEDGEIQYRALQSGSDEDWVYFTVTNTFDVQLTVVGTTNAGLELYDATPALIATNTSGWPSYCYLVTNNLPGSTYYARVYSPPGAAISNYALQMAVLNLLDVHEPDNQLTNARVILPREMSYHSLYPSNDVDYVSFTLTNTAYTRIWTMGEWGGNTAIHAYNSNGTLIASNTNTPLWPYNYYSYLGGTLPADKYYIRVNDVSNTAPASYQILLETYTPDSYEPNNTYTQATPIASGQRLHGTIVPATDIDWFVFSLSNRANVLVLTDTINPYADFANSLLTLLDSNRTAIVSNHVGNNTFVSGTITNSYSAIYQADLEPGEYFITAQSYSDGTRSPTEDPDYYVALDVFSAAAEMTRIDLQTNGTEIVWQGDASFTYRVEATSNQSWTVPDIGWAAVTTLNGRVDMNVWTDPDTATNKWYRVVAE